MEVATYVVRALGHDPASIAWKEIRSAERESSLTRRVVDLVVATYAITDRRAQQVDFAGPYLTAHQDVLLRADDTGVTRPADLDRKSVCSAIGSSSAENVHTKITSGAYLMGRTTYEQCMEDLASGDVDAVTADDAMLAGYAEQDAYRGRFRLAGFRLTDERYCVGLAKGSPLRAKVDAALRAMTADGSNCGGRREEPSAAPDDGFRPVADRLRFLSTCPAVFPSNPSVFRSRPLDSALETCSWQA